MTEEQNHDDLSVVKYPPGSYDVAERIARVLVCHAEAWFSHQRCTHMSVVSANRREPPPFPFHWQRKNTFGCSWPRHERDVAVQWTKTALEHGFTVFYGTTKSGGGGAGRGLEHGPYDERDEREAEEWLARHPVQTPRALKADQVVKTEGRR